MVPIPDRSRKGTGTHQRYRRPAQWGRMHPMLATRDEAAVEAPLHERECLVSGVHARQGSSRRAVQDVYIVSFGTAQLRRARYPQQRPGMRSLREEADKPVLAVPVCLVLWHRYVLSLSVSTYSASGPLTNTRLIMSLRLPECQDRKSTRLNSSHSGESRMPSSA